MKKSLFWRGLLIVAVLLGWAYALYPLHDRDYLETFEGLAQVRVGPQLENAIEEAKTLVSKAKKEGSTLTVEDAFKQVALRRDEKGVQEITLSHHFHVPPKADEKKEPEAPSMGKESSKKAPDNDEVLTYLSKQAEGKDYIDTIRELSLATNKKRLEEILTTAKDRVAKSREAAKKAEEAILSGNADADPVRVVPMEEAIVDACDQIGAELFNFIDIYGKTTPTNKEVVYYVRDSGRGKLKFGLDLRGGTEFRVTFDEAKVKELKLDPRDVREDIMNVLRDRLDPKGVAEIEIRPDAGNSITIRTPSTDRAERARIGAMIGESGKLEFRMVHEDNSRLLASGQAPGIEYELVDYIRNDDRGNETKSKIWVMKRPVLVPDKIKAFARRDAKGMLEVGVELDQSSGAIMLEATAAAKDRENADGGKPQSMAIMLDGIVKSAPYINSPFGSSFVITGTFSMQEVTDLALILRSGRLPVPIKIDSEMTTAPTLGADRIQSGMLALAIGMVLVVVFMVAYYRGAGVVAVIALTANVLLIFGTLPIVRAALTLPGIAGIVLTIGMAVDANVLIFERIREELNNGKSLATAIKNGYGRAFVTILDANLTTLFTAYFLYLFGTGTVKGFAVTLSIGICASMFTALFVTRCIFDALVEFNLLKSPKLMHSRLKPAEQGKEAEMGKQYQFLNLRSVTALVSGVLIVGSLIVVGVRRNTALGVDFAGGAMVTMNSAATEKIPSTEIQGALKTIGLDNAKVTYKASPAANAQTLEIVIPDSYFEGDNKTEDIEKRMVAELNKAHPAGKFSGGSYNKVGGLVGKEFQKKALYAMFFALLAIIVYISFRFQLSYAMGAVAALVHDVIICSGIFLALGSRQISLVVIAALLTIIGYSLNDTIVVFDRVRENLDFYKKKKFLEIINLSINQTLSRTILTSLTTLLVVLSLFIVGGGGAINDFSLVMLAGIVVGTYSSIFVATPVMILWQTRVASGAAKESSGSKAAKQSA